MIRETDRQIGRYRRERDRRKRRETGERSRGTEIEEKEPGRT